MSLRPAKNLNIGLNQFSQHFEDPTSLEVDLLTVAAAVFCADLAVKRGERENVARAFELTIPVTNLASFNSAKPKLQVLLARLSYDAWDIRFVQRPGAPETPSPVNPAAGQVLLFSGGLDSLAAAVDFGEAGDRTVLVSHVTANRSVTTAQEQVFRYLDQTFRGLFERLSFRVGGRNSTEFPFPTDQDREESQRTRSFLFLSLAALVARRRGLSDVVFIAENGQMAIHLPLTAARIGAFSTQTAHPAVVGEAEAFFSSLLQAPIRIRNPFLYKTKAETVASLVQHHRAALRSSISCWKASRVPGELNHCGFCIPCLIRRIAIEHNGFSLGEYARDILSENVGSLAPDDEGKRNLVELAEFAHMFSQGYSQAELEQEYPDLVSTRFDAVQAAQMYSRFAAECGGVLRRYPQLTFLLT